VFNRLLESRKLIGIIINKAQGALSAHSRSLPIMTRPFT